MGFLDIFRQPKKKVVEKWKELGVYNATFSVFGNDAYNSAIVRASIRPLADFSAKAYATCPDKKLERMLNRRPNMYMSGHDFLMKVRTRMELLNTAFIYLQRNDAGEVVGAYPVPYAYFDALECAGRLFIKFYFASDAQRTITLPWEDLAAVRKDYNKSDIAGDDNNAIVSTLQTLQTVDEGLANSIKATANLRGILKSTKAMLSPEHIKAQKEEFVRDYMSLENASGIASLDSTQEFTPIDMKPATANYEQRKEIREDIYRYFGVNDSVIMGKLTTEELENFYKLRIEPFLQQLSVELTSKIYPGRAGAYDKNEIVYMSDVAQFMTMAQKIELFNKVVLYGGMLIDEWRKLIGLGHIEGGDKPIRRLDTAPVDVQNNKEGNDDATDGEDE